MPGELLRSHCKVHSSFHASLQERILEQEKKILQRLQSFTWRGKHASELHSTRHSAKGQHRNENLPVVYVRVPW